MDTKRLLPLFSCSLLLISCGESPPPEAAETKKPSHPWDWVPEDAELVSGRSVYLSECSMCHDEGEEGAPALTNAAEWATREAKTPEVLFDHAINGFVGNDGEMPARGGTPSLTDEQVIAAVKYMLATPK